MAPLASIHKKSVLCELLCMLHRHYRATTACNLYPLSPTLEVFLCRNSEEVETIGNVSDWCHVTFYVSFVASLRLEQKSPNLVVS